MQTDILHRFLDNRLFDIGPEDERLTRLRTAAKTVAASIAGNPARVPSVAMVAFDPKVPADDPVMNDVATAVSESWTTYTSVFADRPVVVFRAVLLEALRQSQEESTEIAGAVGLTARNMLPLLDLGLEKSVWADLTARSEELMAVKAAENWAVDIAQAPEAKAIPSPAKLGKLDRKVLLAKVEAAVGPTNEKGEPLTNPNAHWPNQGQPWSHLFAPRLATAIADSIDGIAETVASARSQTDAAMLRAMQEFVTSVVPDFLRVGRAMERRLDLLWWRQSMYSNAAGRSYRSMKPEAAAVQMAVDLFASTPPLGPRSVEFFLREAVAEAIADGKGQVGSMTFRQVATSKAIKSEVAVGSPANSFAAGPGRRPLTSLLFGAGGETEEALGVPSAHKIRLDELAVWVLREMQAKALLRGDAQQ